MWTSIETYYCSEQDVTHVIISDRTNKYSEKIEGNALCLDRDLEIRLAKRRLIKKIAEGDSDEK